MKTVLLHTPDGVRDIYGKEYKRKLEIEQRLFRKLMLFGYEPIQTPAFEYLDVYSGGNHEHSHQELYKFFDKEGEILSLRPDFTPAIARCAAKYFMEKEEPFRFCYQGNTFLNTSNLQGKLKEVTQTGGELIGDDSVEADAEMIHLAAEALFACGLEQFQISVGQVAYYKGLCLEAGLDMETELLLKDSISKKNYFAAKELLTEKSVPVHITELLLNSANTACSMEEVLRIKDKIQNIQAKEALERLEKLYKCLEGYGSEKYVSFDLGMLSNYDYYTGMIFKVYTYGIGDAIAKGGRYDVLLQKYGKNAPAIGFAIVVDDLLEALEQQKIMIPISEEKTVLYYDSSNYAELLQKAVENRAKGIPTELIRRKKMV